MPETTETNPTIEELFTSAGISLEAIASERAVETGVPTSIHLLIPGIASDRVVFETPEGNAIAVLATASTVYTEVGAPKATLYAAQVEFVVDSNSVSLPDTTFVTNHSPSMHLMFEDLITALAKISQVVHTRFPREKYSAEFQQAANYYNAAQEATSDDGEATEGTNPEGTAEADLAATDPVSV